MKTEQEILNKIKDILKLKINCSDSFLKIALEDEIKILKWAIE